MNELLPLIVVGFVIAIAVLLTQLRSRGDQLNRLRLQLDERTLRSETALDELRRQNAELIVSKAELIASRTEEVRQQIDAWRAQTGGVCRSKGRFWNPNETRETDPRRGYERSSDLE